MSEDKLNEIKVLLEDIKGLLLLSNQDKIEESKKKLLKSGSTEELVYNLCDGTNTNEGIATKIQKTDDNVRAVISSLRQKGLIKTIEKDGKRIHEQRF